MIQVNVNCPFCKTSLMDETHPVDGYPGIRTMARIGTDRREIWLSSVFGSYHFDCEVEIPKDLEVQFHCPHCGVDLTGSRRCETCGARMAHLRMHAGGVIQFCSRRGCRKHLLEFEDVETEVTDFYRKNPIFWTAYLDDGEEGES